MSMRRTSRRYLRSAVDTSHEFQEFLTENPAVASGLASVGNLMVNAMMQSKYGPAIQQLLNPAAGATAAGAAAPAAVPAKPAAAKAAAKKAGPARPPMKKKVAKKKKKVAKKKVARKAK